MAASHSQTPGPASLPGERARQVKTGMIGFGSGPSLLAAIVPTPAPIRYPDKPYMRRGIALAEAIRMWRTGKFDTVDIAEATGLTESAVANHLAKLTLKIDGGRAG